MIFSQHSAQAIVANSHDVPFFRIDDVYVTGLVYSHRLGGAITDLPANDNSNPRAFDPCRFHRDHFYQVLRPNTDLKETWRKLQHAKYFTDCLIKK